ncbi:MAG: PAS domain S-box protein [Crocinitomicaceae bacterium]|nr:PAS domain S-box protein [Crocinitomicaceae bacterium]
MTKLTTEKSLLKASVLDALSSHIAVVDENGIIIETNRAWEEFGKNYNSSKSKRIGKGEDYFNVIRDLDSENGDKLCTNLREIINGKRDYFYFDYPCHTENEKRWYTMRVTSAPEVKGAVIAHSNITERVLAEYKLKEQEKEANEFARIINESLNEVYIFDSESLLYIDVNNGGQMNIGYSMKELRKLTPIDLKPEFDEDSFKRLINGFENSDKVKIQFETYHKRKDGSFYAVEVHLQKSFYKEKNAFLAMVMDISQRKESQLKLIKNEREFRSLAENAPYHFIKLSRYYRIEFINRGGFGFSREDLIGKSAFDVIDPKNGSLVRQKLNSVFENGKPVYYESIRRISKEESIVFATQVGPVKNDTGDVVSLIVIMRDITEESKYKRELEVAHSELIKIDEINQFALYKDNSMDELIQKMMGLLAQFANFKNGRFYICDKNYKKLILKHQEVSSSIAQVIKTIVGSNKEGMVLSVKEGSILLDILESDKTKVIHGKAGINSFIEQLWSISKYKKIAAEIIDLMHVKTILFIPMSIQGEVFGLMTLMFDQELKGEKIDKIQRYVNGVKSALGKKYASEKIEESELRYKTLFESINEGFVMMSPEGEIQMTNPKFRNLLGYDENELIGMKGNDILKGVSKRQFNEKLDERRSGKSETYESTLRKYNGERIWVEINASPRFNSKNEFIGAVSLIRDITDKKRKEAWSYISSSITEVISSEDVSLQDILSSAQKVLSTYMSSENFYVCQRKGDGEIQFVYYENVNSNKVAPFTGKIENGLIELILSTGDPLILNEEELKEFVPKKQKAKSKALYKSWIGAPLISKGHVIGVIACQVYSNKNSYDQFDLDLLQYIGQQLGVYIEKIKSLEDKERLISISRDLICVAGHDGYFKYVNPAFTEVLGYTKEELLNNPFVTFVHPEDHHSVEGEMDNLNAGNQTMGYVNRYIAKDGDIVWLSWLATPIEEDGLYYCIARDITKEREVQNRIKESERRYRGIFEGMNEGILYSGPAGEILEVNPGFCRTLGYSREELIGKIGYDLLHDESTALRLKQKLKYRENGDSGNYETTFLTKSRGEIIVQVSSAPNYDNEGKFSGVLSIIMEITERKRAELEALRLKEAFTLQLKEKVQERTRELEEAQLESKYQLDTLNESALVSVTDLNGIITYANNKFCKRSKFLPEELIGETHRILKSEKQDPKVFVDLWQTISAGNVWNGEIMNKAKDGTFYWVDTTIVPFFNTRGEIDKYVSVRFDITQQKEQQQQLVASLEKEQELSELKSRFVATASHQFRTPLSVIQSKMAVLAMQESSMGSKFKPKFNAVFKTIQEQIKRMTSLMNEVLILGKINAGNINVSLESSDLREVCQEMIGNFNIIFGNSIINMEITGEPYEIDIDRKLFENSVSNLLSNAIKYSPEDPKVIVGIHFKPEHLLLTVRDNGIGIPKDELEHLFEPFYRASNVKDVPGTGLGTSIAKEYLELIGGRLDVKSTLGEGTEIIVRFKNN